MLKRSRCAGFTLVELMIALVLGSAATAAAIGLLSSTLAMYKDTLHRTRMNQDLRQLTDVMQHDLTRAGAWGVAGAVAVNAGTHDLAASAVSGSVTLQSLLPGTATVDAAFGAPLSAAVLEGRRLVISARAASGATRRYELSIDRYLGAAALTATLAAGDTLPSMRISAGSWTVLSPFSELAASGGDCLVFSYDENGDGVRDASSERYGYRYNAADRAVRAVNNADSCGSGNWENVSDERVLRVNALSLGYIAMPTVSATAGLQGQRRYGSFVVNAQLRESAGADRVLRGGAALRNDALR
jgi:prepilin-type N-terminal cleavage/methylation domain-containing protein